eukprot:201078-Pleurochrysis_carterae.AAC.1
MREVVRHVVSDDEDVVVGKARSVVEEGKVIRKVTRRGFCSKGWGNWRKISFIEGTRTPESSVRRLRGAQASTVVDR